MTFAVSKKRNKKSIQNRKKALHGRIFPCRAFLVRISEIFCQSQNFLFQKGIEHIIACVAPMHAIELKQCIIRFEALCFLNVQKCLIYINDGTMIALCQLFDDFPIFFNAVGVKG